MEIKEKTCLVDLTAQETFDKVSYHLLTQNERAIDELGECRYRQETIQENGQSKVLKCAAGAIIPDEYYLLEFEGKIFFYVQEKSRKEFGFPMANNSNLITKLQKIHDKNFPEYWKSLLLALAQEEGLNSEILNQFS